MGIGVASGPNRAIEAARMAISSPLLEVDINGATDAIVQITSDYDITMKEVEDIITEIQNASSTEIEIIHGSGFNPELAGEVVVIVIATGFDSTEKEEKVSEPVYVNEPQPTFEPTTRINVPHVESGSTSNEAKEKKETKVPSWLQSRFK